MTTHVIYADNPNEALYQGLRLLRAVGKTRPSRNGDVLEMPGTVINEYLAPYKRVLLNPVRDANPFFHLYEAMWMLAGRNDLEPLQQLVKTFGNYSDDGHTLHGAYGYRWLHHYGEDNLAGVVDLLRRDPATRRAYLPMWDGAMDPHHLEGTGKDYPCNVGVNFLLRDHNLHMTVFCRSNDAIWGTYGANLVHFGFLQEYVACQLGVGIGTYRQVSDSFHVYTNNPLWTKLSGALENVEAGEPWPGGHAGGYAEPGDPGGLLGVTNGWRLFEGEAEREPFHHDLECLPDPIEFVHHYHHPGHGFHSLFFQTVVAPMMMSWCAARLKNWSEAQRYAAQVSALDWRAAAQMWITARQQSALRKEERS